MSEEIDLLGAMEADASKLICVERFGDGLTSQRPFIMVDTGVKMEPLWLEKIEPAPKPAEFFRGWRRNLLASMAFGKPIPRQSLDQWLMIPNGARINMVGIYEHLKAGRIPECAGEPGKVKLFRAGDQYAVWADDVLAAKRWMVRAVAELNVGQACQDAGLDVEPLLKEITP